jgi:hypothetical protein
LGKCSENITISAKASQGCYELKKDKQWFEEGCSELLDQGKQAKLQWLKNPSEMNGDNLNNIRRETNNHFRKNKREYLNVEINEIATDSYNKNMRDPYRGINEFKKGHQRRSNLAKDENGDLLAHSHNILNWWKNYFSQLLNAHRISFVRQTEIHAAKPLVLDHSPIEVEIYIAGFKKHKSSSGDQISAELLKAGDEALRSEIHKLITSVWSKEKLPDQWKESVIVPVYKKGDKIEYSNYTGLQKYFFFQLHGIFLVNFMFSRMLNPKISKDILLPTSCRILSNIVSRLSPYIDENIGDHQCGFRRNRSFAFVRYWRKNGSTMRQYISYS